MTAADLYTELKNLKAYKKDRVRIGLAAVNDQLIEDLIELSRAASDVSHQACWCLEQSFLLKEKELYPYLNELGVLFTEQINSSGMRSLVKIASICCKKYYSQRNTEIQQFITEQTRENMVEGCFRSLIEHEDKTANAAFATRALYELGKEHDWIHEELKIKIQQIMERNPTSGYRACAKQTLTQIHQFQNDN